MRPETTMMMSRVETSMVMTRVETTMVMVTGIESTMVMSRIKASMMMTTFNNDVREIMSFMLFTAPTVPSFHPVRFAGNFPMTGVMADDHVVLSAVLLVPAHGPHWRGTSFLQGDVRTRVRANKLEVTCLMLPASVCIPRLVLLSLGRDLPMRSVGDDAPQVPSTVILVPQSELVTGRDLSHVRY